MSEQSTSRDRGAVENTVTPSTDTVTVERAAAETGRGSGGGLMSGSFGRNLGLVVALLLICAAGIITAGDRFASVDNTLTILRFASTIGVVSIGMTFVIIGGGIDLSVGAIVALASVWSTTIATQTLAADTHWIVMVGTALLVGACCGLVNGVLIAYGRLAPFIATLAMLAGARGLAEIIAQRRTQLVSERGFVDFFGGDVLGIPRLVVIFALVAVWQDFLWPLMVFSDTEKQPISVALVQLSQNVPLTVLIGAMVIAVNSRRFGGGGPAWGGAMALNDFPRPSNVTRGGRKNEGGNVAGKGEAWTGRGD